MACSQKQQIVLWMLVTLPVASSCALFRKAGPSAPVPNPVEIPVESDEFAWNELVDAIDDFFPIAREERVRLIGNVMTEGRIVTKAVNGASVLEFFRRDVTRGFERWHGTFQSIRRSAEVRVAPSRNGYAVTVIVRKELEDVAAPELSPIGNVIDRHDGSLARPSGPKPGSSKSLGWIPVGRDVSLEQKILTEIYTRFYKFAPPPPVEIVNDEYLRKQAMPPRQGAEQ